MSIRKNQDRLSVWVNNVNENSVLAAGNLLKSVLQAKIVFQVHSESIKAGTAGSSFGGRQARFVL